MEHITIETLLTLDNPTIIDVRSKEQYDTFHVPDAIHIPEVGAILNADTFFNKETTYHIICNSGNSSLQVATMLDGMGYKCVNVLGGTEAYKAFMQNN